MAEPFDAYHELLGIPPREQPPNHYRLLGISLFEANREVIANAALARSKFLRSLGISDYADVCQRLLNEVAEAKLCLSDPKKKAAYDERLCADFHAGPPPADERVAPRARPVSVTMQEIRPPAKVPAVRPAAKEPTVRPASKRPAEPSPPRAARGPEQSWTIGRSPDCDILVDSPAVSATHCRLTKTGKGFYLEDLNSTNGTYVNRVRISGRVEVSRQDVVTLGKRTPMPWPSPGE